MDVVLLVLAGSATALATGLGTLPVFFMGSRAELLRPILLGAMLALVAVEFLPQAFGHRRWLRAGAGSAPGAAAMLALAASVGV